MFPKSKYNSLQPVIARQRGSMLVIAIFILTVLGLLGLAIVQILSDSSRSIVYEVYGARALNAANSGAEWALGDIFSTVPSVDCSAGAADSTLNLSSQTAFHGCEVKVSCNKFDINQTKYTHYRIESSARCNVGEFVTDRKVAVEAREKF